MSATNDDINKLKRWACGPHAATIIDVCDELMRLRTAALVVKTGDNKGDNNCKGDNKGDNNSLVSVTPKRAPGRPKVEGARPWQGAGISRKTWYKRKSLRS